jgi:hypothetical protein
MRSIGAMRGMLGVLCTAMAVLGLAPGGAQGAPGDPIFIYTASPKVPPGTGFEGPCGLAVDSAANLYVSDHNHRVVDVFGPIAVPVPTLDYRTQFKEADPLGGPCGSAVDSIGRVYVNNFHRSVIRYTPSGFPPGGGTTYGSGLTIDSQHPTGVAVDPANRVYVNQRDRIAVYDPSGVHLEDIGVGSLADGYGLAYAGGHLYVPDAETNTVEVYNPLVSATIPEKVLTGPPSGFASLADSAIAVDRVSGDVYVADRQSSPFTERPESTIQVFDSIGSYKGHLKYNVIDAAPVGLAVDNSVGANQGRVYVTSGNTSGASVYAYPPGAATSAATLPSSSTFALGASGAEGAVQQSDAESAEPQPAPPVAAASEIAQQNNLRLSVDGEISPRRLPRQEAVPISVSIGWRMATTDGTTPPQLRTLRIDINRAGRFDLTGLPTCPYAKIQPASTERALANCRPALVGRGSFSALIALAGQESYVASGQMLVFHGRQGRKSVLFGQIYSPRPFANSFVIVFALDENARGTYGTSLRAKLPPALLSWGSLTEIQMRLSRRFGYRGERRSFVSASCPAPEGAGLAVFHLARTSFSFVGAPPQLLTLDRSCRVSRER